MGLTSGISAGRMGRLGAAVMGMVSHRNAVGSRSDVSNGFAKVRGEQQRRLGFFARERGEQKKRRQ